MTRPREVREGGAQGAGNMYSASTMTCCPQPAVALCRQSELGITDRALVKRRHVVLNGELDEAREIVEIELFHHTIAISVHGLGRQR